MKEAKVTAKKSVAKFGTADGVAVTTKYSNPFVGTYDQNYFLQYSERTIRPIYIIESFSSTGFLPIHPNYLPIDKNRL